jgi:hypothetical protein
MIKKNLKLILLYVIHQYLDQSLSLHNYISDFKLYDIIFQMKVQVF